jgi:carbon monoxide dehydrogenase subunit G
MSIDVAAEVEIARPRAEVAAFMFDPTKDARWTTGVVEAKPLQDGLLRLGAKVDRVSRFLGRRLEYRIEVVAAEPERFVEMIATQPFEIRVRYELEDIDEQHTRVRIRTAGGGTGFFRLAAPLLAKMVRRSIAADLVNLERCLVSA